MLVFDHVTKKFPHFGYALSGINLTIKRGEFVFLVGTSGAGKTTLLRLVTRELLPSEGKIVIDDINIGNIPSNKIPYLRRKITMIFQDFKVLTDRTAFENVAVTLEILGLKENQIKADVSAALNMVGLSSKTRLFPVQMSAGELQRLSIARAIVGNPSVLLADEPTGNLDPKTGWEILSILSDINIKNNTTIIMATHNVEVVNRMKKRVVALESGKIIRDQHGGSYI